jgi:hypothetical protein
MRKTLTFAAALATLAALSAGPAAATTARPAAACPPGTTDTTYCEVVVFLPGLNPVAKQKLLVALNKGLKVSFTCNEVCTITITATMPGKTAHKLHIAKKLPKKVVVAKGKAKLTKAGKGVVKLKFTKKAKKALKKLKKGKKVKLTLNAKFADAVGNKATKSRTVTLKR